MTTETQEKENLLIERALDIFRGKLIQCGYTEQEITKILSKVKKDLEKRLLGPSGFEIIWSIDLKMNLTEFPLSSNQKKENQSKTLIDLFKRLKINIEPLGFYIMDVDARTGSICVSEKRGVQPKPVFVL